MNIAFNEVAIAVLKKRLQDCSLDELQQLADQYPYFSPAHLLLAKKLQEESSSSYEEQVQKTSLYFQNRLWLNYLLNDNEAPDIIIENKQGKNEEPAAAGEEYQAETNETGIIQEKPEENVMETETPIQTTLTNTEPTTQVSAESEANPEPVNEEMAKQIETRLDLSQFKIEPIASGSELAFEPYHT